MASISREGSPPKTELWRRNAAISRGGIGGRIARARTAPADPIWPRATVSVCREGDVHRQVSRLHLYRATHGDNCLADDRRFSRGLERQPSACDPSSRAFFSDGGERCSGQLSKTSAPSGATIRLRMAGRRYFCAMSHCTPLWPTVSLIGFTRVWDGVSSHVSCQSWLAAGPAWRSTLARRSARGSSSITAPAS